MRIILLCLVFLLSVLVLVLLSLLLYIYHTGDGGGRVQRESEVENEELRRQPAAARTITGKLRQRLAARDRTPSLEEVCRMARADKWEDSAGWGWGAAHSCSG